MANSSRVRAVVIHDERLLVLERWKAGEHYYVFVGGGIDSNESSQAAVEREVFEESSLRIKPERIVYVHTDKYGGVQDFWLCSLVGNTVLPQLQENTDEYISTQEGSNRYKPCWIALSELGAIDLKPHSIRDRLVSDRAVRWPTVELTR